MRRTLVAAVLLAVLPTINQAPAEAADPLGPFCVTLDVFADRLEIFALPNGAGQFLLSVRNVDFPNAYVGNATVSGSDLIFTFVSGQVFEAGAVTFSGTLDLATLTGVGKCVILPAGESGCGAGQELIYTVTVGACPP